MKFASTALLLLLFLVPAAAARAEHRAVLERTVLVAIDRAYPPHQFMDAKGEPVGFDVDLFRAVATATGLRYELRLGEWPEIRDALEAAEIDLNPGVFFTRLRAEHLAFSVPTTHLHHTVFVRSGSPVREPRDLLGRSVIVNRGGIHDDWIRERDLPVDPIRARDAEDAITRLAAGEGEAAVVLDTQGLYYLRSRGLQGVHSVGKPLDAEALRFAVPRSRVDLLAVLNDGLARVRSEGTYDLIYDRWFGVLEPRRFGVEETLRWLGTGVGVVVLVGALVLLWTRGLKRRVTRASRQLLESDARLRATLLAAPGIAYLVADGVSDEAVILDASAGAERLVGLDRDELSGCRLGSLRSPADVQRHATLAPDPGGGRSRQAELVRSGGSRVPAFVFASPLPDHGIPDDAAGGAGRVLLVLVDLSERVRGEEERRALERRVLESEKMEALGRLAGSVAHDFNNVLMSIQSTLHELRGGLVPGKETAQRLSAVDVACATAARIVSQLQAFGGSEATRPRPLTWNEALLEIEPLLRGSLRAGIRLELRLAPEPWTVLLDPVEAQQVLLNLVLNARDSISGAGVIEIATSNRVLGGVPMAVLDVRDEGRGMRDEERSRVFEPFYTTRGGAGGTGLGLATVRAVAQRAGGHAEIRSELERGTRVRVALPRAPKASGQESSFTV